MNHHCGDHPIYRADCAACVNCDMLARVSDGRLDPNTIEGEPSVPVETPKPSTDASP